MGTTRDLGTLGRVRAWVQDGTVHVNEWPIGKGDRLVATLGGMSAAIGIVPMEITLKRADGSSDEIYGTAVDEQMTDDNSRDVYQAMVTFFRMVANEAGCVFEEG